MRARLPLAVLGRGFVIRTYPHNTQRSSVFVPRIIAIVLHGPISTDSFIYRCGLDLWIPTHFGSSPPSVPLGGRYSLTLEERMWIRRLLASIHHSFIATHHPFFLKSCPLGPNSTLPSQVTDRGCPALPRGGFVIYNPRPPIPRSLFPTTTPIESHLFVTSNILACPIYRAQRMRGESVQFL